MEDEDEFRPPPMPLARGPGSRVRIPPELMPDDDLALHYFELFFTHVHQYVPVLSKTMFYRQWHHERHNMSPLILEAIFAISGRIANEPAQGQQWLALASSERALIPFSLMGLVARSLTRLAQCTQTRSWTPPA
jgi:hypothetical protein